MSGASESRISPLAFKMAIGFAGIVLAGTAAYWYTSGKNKAKSDRAPAIAKEQNK